MRSSRILAVALCLALGIGQAAGATPIGTVFTYQGRLIDANSTADGLYDFQFKLYDANVVGTQKGSTISISEVDVIDGYFTVLLDFSSGVFDGNDRWLQIAVRAGDLNDPNVYTTLSPRQELTATPYAIYAKTADSISVGIDWIEIFNRPAGLDDGDQVGITTETDPVYVGSPAFGITWSNITNWNTAYGWGNHALAGYLKTEIDPTVLASVKDGITWTEVSSRPAGLDDGDQVGITSETDPTVLASVKDGITWTEVSNRPAGLDDGDQVGITSELDPQVGSNTTNYIPKWDGSALVTGTIYDNGNVGIGTMSPGNKLDVAGGGGNLTYGTDNTLTVKGNSQAIIAIDRGTTGHAGDLEFKTQGATKWNVGMMGTDNDLRFYSWAGAGQTLFLDAVSGNVGIGTASPIAKLEVKGNIKTEVIYETYMTKDWTPVESDRDWRSVAMSADGTKQTAVVFGGQIYVSTDSGNTWIAKESNRDWRSVAMSADGTKQTAVVFGGQIYVSTNSGNTWIAKESDRGWWSVAMSADGIKQTAVVFDGQIYVSTNSGNTWTAKESNRWWRSVAMSADGIKQTAVDFAGQIYVSTDSGNTWIAKESNRNWTSVAMSADGTKQTAVVWTGRIYVSTDSGNTWTAKESSRGWESVAMSADGTKQTAVVGGGQIYVSTNSGNTWIAKESDRDWLSVAMSADGTKQTAVVNGGQIYISGGSGVGIGTTTPAGKLDVNGSIYQRGAMLHADYVFEPSYKLESIDEQSEFMWREKHLPAMPKIQKDENGREMVEIGARSRGVVEELEKAHIYIEHLHSRVNQLEEQNRKLEQRMAAMESLVAKMVHSQEGGM